MLPHPGSCRLRNVPRNCSLTSVIGILGLLLSVCVPTDAFRPLTGNPSIMIVGDSISQGRNGDFTWRYRLWDWFNSNGVPVKFVGPYTGTVQQDPGDPATPPIAYGQNTTQIEPGPIRQLGGYNAAVPSSFLSGGQNHFAAWGRQLAQDAGLIQGVVSQYQPDYILLELGFNDVGWFISDASGTIYSMTHFITNARAAKPDIAFAIANIPQRTYIGGRDDLIAKTDQYNALLPNLIDGLSTPQSPIQLVQFRENYSCSPTGCPAGSDGLHPNALGEFQIAKAFADGLSQRFNWPGSAFRIPGNIPVRACGTPTNVVARATPCGVTVSWDPVDGAYGYTVSYGFNGGSTSFLNVTAPLYTTTWTAAGIEWTYQVLAICSDMRSGLSGQVSAIAKPSCAPGPSNVVVKSTADGLDFTWDAVSGYNVATYGAIYWDRNKDAFLQNNGWSGTSASYHGLKPGDRVLTAVETWATVDGILCAGLPAGGQGVIVGGVMPATPSGLKVATINEGATVQLTFNGDSNAFAYGFYTRSLMKPNQPYQLGGYISTVPCIEITYLIPGAWNFEFCVVAYNGNYSTPMSECLQAPKDTTKVGACPVLPDPSPSNSFPTVTWSTPNPTTTVPGGGGGGSIVYIDPKIWSSQEPTAACEPPCTLVLPPWTLSSMTTIPLPVVTETIEETWPETTSGVVLYRTTTLTVLITLPPVTTSVIEVSNIIIISSTSEVVPVKTSIIAPPVTLTEPTHGITYTYKPGPFPTGIDVGPPPGGNPGHIHISAGPPGPICILGCGHICLLNCGSGGGGGGSYGCIGGGCPPGSGDCVGDGCQENKETTTTRSTRTCATETNTECHQVCTTKPCATVCNTYVGCDCTTSTVTDYWVSCQSKSCTTTSSDVITGCFLTATATTQGSYCPTITVDPNNDDEGDDDSMLGNLGSTFTTTYSEIVIVQQTPYPVISGYVTVDKTAYPIPAVSSASKTTLGGTSALIVPPFVGTTVSITLTNIVISTRSNPPATTTISPSKSSTSTVYPTNTAINVGGAYCFPQDAGYLSFSLDETKSVVKSFCSSHYVLQPDNVIGQADALQQNGYNVVVSAKWASDQTGCGAKQAFPFADDNLNFGLCLNGWSTDFFCNDENQSTESSYGGAYVLKPPNTGGCILLSLYAYSTTNSAKLFQQKMPSIPPAMNYTHMGDKTDWAPKNKTGVGIIWPTSQGTLSGGHNELFSPVDIGQLLNNSSRTA